jgi:hypothetical protein
MVNAVVGIILALAILGFIVWAIVRGVRNKGIKAHNVSYALSVIAGVFTYGYILSLD